METSDVFKPSPPKKFPLGFKIVSQLEYYAALTDPNMDRGDIAFIVEPVLLALEERLDAPQYTDLQSALSYTGR